MSVTNVPFAPLQHEVPAALEFEMREFPGWAPGFARMIASDDVAHLVLVRREGQIIIYMKGISISGGVTRRAEPAHPLSVGRFVWNQIPVAGPPDWLAVETQPPGAGAS